MRADPRVDELYIRWTMEGRFDVPRELFPYEGDRLVIRAFLQGHAPSKLTQLSHISDRMNVSDSKLQLDGSVIAWFDTAGALTININGAYPVSMIRVIDYINELLGITDGKISYISGEGLQWTIGDTLINPGEPVVIAGPLSIQAYRASLKE